MARNVGGLERPLRILVGLLILSAALFHVGTGGLAIAAYVVGAIAFVTGLAGYCPAWSVFGINTCHGKNVKAGATKTA